MRKTNFILLVFFLSSTALSAQAVAVSKTDILAVFEKINEWFANTASYSVTVTHASYESYTAQVPAEKSVGYFKKENENYHSFIIGVHTIQNNNYKLVIDTAEKVILVANPDQLAWNKYTPEDYLTLINGATSIVSVPNGQDKLYRLQLPANAPIGSYEFLVNDKGLLKSVVWYYNKELKKEDDSKIKPRVSITFSGYKKDVPFNYNDIFSDEPYFLKKENKLVTTAKYKEYKLSDQRLRN